jgi:hypothetical protein
MLSISLVIGCNTASKHDQTVTQVTERPILTFSEANRLARLPLECMGQEYPNKLNQSLNDSTFLGTPKKLHPAFFGCYDWHSAVHGHWSLVSLIKQFPALDQADTIRTSLLNSLSKENIASEVAYFKIPGNDSYERTYGWAWILKLAEELHTWDDSLARELENNLQPLTDLMARSFIEFLPKLNYPIRVGEHTNTAFALSFAFDYADTFNNMALKEEIKKTIERFYVADNKLAGCPLNWEPSGFDFLSPCLEEANLVRRIYSNEEFKKWFAIFLPQLSDPKFHMEPGKILDRTDGKLVHLDGLNFSRAWCLYGIAETLPEYGHLKIIADEHINYSLPNLMDDNYGGTHWLGTFALYALNKAR